MKVKERGKSGRNHLIKKEVKNMATSVSERPKYNQYLGNSNPKKMEVHDRSNETPRCQIDEIIANGHAVVFTPDTLDEARKEGYDKCAFCIGGSLRKLQSAENPVIPLASLKKGPR